MNSHSKRTSIVGLGLRIAFAALAPYSISAVGMVWMPYDLYLNGVWSHCGADVFTLVKADGKWSIVSIAWSAEQPPVCEKHPSGPPAKP